MVKTKVTKKWDGVKKVQVSDNNLPKTPKEIQKTYDKAEEGNAFYIKPTKDTNEDSK